MAPSKQYDEGGQLQLMEADRVEEEEECFESIDKRTFAASSPTPPNPVSDAAFTCLFACVRASRACGCVGVGRAQ
jgi:meiotic recombination protein DMC1